MVGTLQELYQALGNRRMTLCRELTKKYETAFRTTIEDLIAFTKIRSPWRVCPGDRGQKPKGNGTGVTGILERHLH